MDETHTEGSGRPSMTKSAGAARARRDDAAQIGGVSQPGGEVHDSIWDCWERPVARTSATEAGMTWTCGSATCSRARRTFLVEHKRELPAVDARGPEPEPERHADRGPRWRCRQGRPGHRHRHRLRGPDRGPVAHPAGRGRHGEGQADRTAAGRSRTPNERRSRSQSAAGRTER